MAKNPENITNGIKTIGTILVATFMSLKAHPAINPILLPHKLSKIETNKWVKTNPESDSFKPIIQYRIISYIIGPKTINGNSTVDFPMK